MFHTVVIGYRSWRMNPQTFGLDGPVSKIEWPPDCKIEAICAPIHVKTLKDPEPHIAPGSQCMCGLYAYHDLAAAQESYCQNKHAVIGVAAFWGKLEIHTSGFKAQYGRLLAIADYTMSEVGDLDRSSILEGVVERYGIPAIPVDLLEQYGSTFGEHIGTQFDDPE
jgi:hypothetical protein